MGDRVIIICTDGKGTAMSVSPAVYLHWGGSDALGYIEKLKERMAGRRGDASYAAAHRREDAKRIAQALTKATA